VCVDFTRALMNVCVTHACTQRFTQRIVQTHTHTHTDESPSSVSLENWTLAVDVERRQTNTLRVFMVQRSFTVFLACLHTFSGT